MNAKTPSAVLCIAFLLVVAAVIAASPLRAELRVHFIDVGQGDAILLETDTAAVLVDAGDANGLAHAYLDRAGVTNIDLAIATHAHADHVGGFASILPALPVGTVWYNGQEHTTRTFERFLDAVLDSGAAYHEPSRGESVAFGSLVIEVIHPQGSARDYRGHLHDMNIVVRAVYGDVAFMLTGDAEAAAEAEMLASGMDLSATVLKLGHHGSRTSTTPAFLQAVSPQVAVYQAGAGNSYGHPHAEPLDLLARAGVQVYGTDEWGTVIATTDGRSVTLSATGPAAGPGGSADRPATDGACVDVNAASVDELSRIVHVGAARAAAIEAGRPWASLAELRRVSGIGPATLADIKEQGLACVGS